MHILPKSQDPEAVGGPDDKFSLALTDPEAPPMSVGQRTQSNIPTEAGRIPLQRGEGGHQFQEN